MRLFRRKPRLAAQTTLALYAIAKIGAGATSGDIARELDIPRRCAAARARWLAGAGLVVYRKGVWFLTDDARGLFTEKRDGNAPVQDPSPEAGRDGPDAAADERADR